MSDSPPAACENCAQPLQGRFCHACGQAAHSPVRSFAHAVEEVFESFWHLDGRIFRTLRRLLAPGALAADFLAGHRAPYVAPMRLFVILCVLTFFVGKLVDFGDSSALPPVQVNGSGNSDFARARSVAEVEQIRDKAITDMEQARESMPAIAAPARHGFDRGIAQIRRQADRRIVELGGTPRAPAPETDAEADAEPANPDAIAISSGTTADGWLERQGQRMLQNLPRIEKDPSLFKYAFMGSVPTALFVLVPLFALLLKLFYLDSGRLYLEHLVVAFYSHAFLCLALLAQFALLALDHWIAPHLAFFGAISGLAAALLWLWMPTYLLLMQKRVYGQGWTLTSLKFVVIGGIYSVTLMLTVMALIVVSLARA
ncbi:DUF3667 domain-containing protein [Pseudoxanthomonas sp. Soil82]|uniref:DUF3667 domain-containing protein n=1 Tax=Pseudoxanthomonas sp. Soil82 TaxID=3157341 RepID=UPI0033905A1E